MLSIRKNLKLHREKKPALFQNSNVKRTWTSSIYYFSIVKKKKKKGFHCNKRYQMHFCIRIMCLKCLAELDF